MSLRNYFLEFPWEIVFSVIPCRQLFISLAVRKCKKNCNILKDVLVQSFCPLKTEIARFHIGFHHNTAKYSSTNFLVPYVHVSKTNSNTQTIPN